MLGQLHAQLLRLRHDLGHAAHLPGAYAKLVGTNHQDDGILCRLFPLHSCFRANSTGTRGETGIMFKEQG